MRSLDGGLVRCGDSRVSNRRWLDDGPVWGVASEPRPSLRVKVRQSTVTAAGAPVARVRWRPPRPIHPLVLLAFYLGRYWGAAIRRASRPRPKVTA